MRVPPAVGVNVTEITQLAPTRTVAPQVFVWAKSVGFDPVNVKPVTFRTSLPWFVSVMVWTALVTRATVVGNVKVVGVRSAVAAVPRPNSAAVCDPPGALSVKTRFAELDPVVFGSNTTLTVQVPPAGTLAPHVFVCWKLVALMPVIAMLVKFNATT